MDINAAVFIIGVRPVCNYFRGQMVSFEKKMYKLLQSFSLLKIDLRLTLILSFDLKHILSNEAVNHDVLGDYIICEEASKGYGVALRPAKFDRFR